mmetsp:Transcript_32623/g.5914  ORF Transcript_32623/g.5914 Transcript_32623/m.5914 type:complete len:82 (+) Transcript_32623:592-837(+)
MFSGRLPTEANITPSGANDIYYFEAIQYEYTVQIDPDDYSDTEPWRGEIDDLIDEFNDNSDRIEVNVYSLDKIERNLWEAL